MLTRLRSARACGHLGARWAAGLAVVFLHSSVSAVAAQEIQTGFLDGVVTVAQQDYRYQVYVPGAYDPGQRWPVILFLHGAGERGGDGLLQTVVGLGDAVRRDPARFPALVVFPQAPADSQWAGAPAEAAMAALDAVTARYATDPDRVYLTGISMGGNGAWYLAYRRPDRFAAVVPICGWVESHPRFSSGQVVPAQDGEPFRALAHRLVSVPIWIFHGDADAAVPVEQSRRAAAALEAAGADVQYTELPGVGHNSWDPAYQSSELSRWLFQQHRAHP
jgi:predicted peptidase